MSTRSRLRLGRLVFVVFFVLACWEDLDADLGGLFFLFDFLDLVFDVSDFDLLFRREEEEVVVPPNFELSNTLDDVVVTTISPNEPKESTGTGTGTGTGADDERRLRRLRSLALADRLPRRVFFFVLVFGVFTLGLS